MKAFQILLCLVEITCTIAKSFSHPVFQITRGGGGHTKSVSADVLKYKLDQQHLLQLRSTYLSEALAARGIHVGPTLTDVSTPEGSKPPQPTDWDCCFSTEEDPKSCLYSFDAEPNTKVIYIESPSNPLMEVIDLSMISKLAKQHGLVTIIDNTMASPVNQNPALFGIDVVIHSATKYMGGHSDILAGTISCSHLHRDLIFSSAKMFGANLSEFTIWLLERSIKTMGLRVERQNANALKLAQWLEEHDDVAKVYYPGLPGHPSHALAKRQMSGFSGMISFELVPQLDAESFLEALNMIKRSMSFAAVESTALLPAKTSHLIIGAEARQAMGISDQLIRFSVGIEDAADLIDDLAQAINAIK